MEPHIAERPAVAPWVEPVSEDDPQMDERLLLPPPRPTPLSPNPIVEEEGGFRPRSPESAAGGAKASPERLPDPSEVFKGWEGGLARPVSQPCPSP